MNTTNKLSKHYLGGLLAAVLGLCSISTAQAQIFVSNTSGNSISEYNLNGTLEQSNLVTGLDSPTLVATNGSGDLFVFNSGNETIGEYTTTGSLVKSDVINTGSALTSLTASGSVLSYFTSNGGLIDLTVGPSGSESTNVNITQPVNVGYDGGVAASGTSLFVTANAYFPQQTEGVGVFTAINGNLTVFTSVSLTITGLNSPTLIAVSGSNLLVYNTGNTTIGQFTTSGSQLAVPLLTLAGGTTAESLASTGTDLYTLESNGNIVDTNLTSETSNTLISGLSSPGGIAVEAQDVPEPSTWAMLLGGLGLLACFRIRTHRTKI